MKTDVKYPKNYTKHNHVQQEEYLVYSELIFLVFNSMELETNDSLLISTPILNKGTDEPDIHIQDDLLLNATNLNTNRTAPSIETKTATTESTILKRH